MAITTVAICTVVVVCLAIAFVSEQLQTSLADDVKGARDGSGIAPANIPGGPQKRHAEDTSGLGAPPKVHRPGVVIMSPAHPKATMWGRSSLPTSTPETTTRVREATTVGKPPTTTPETMTQARGTTASEATDAMPTTTSATTTTTTTCTTTTTASATSTPEQTSTGNATITTINDTSPTTVTSVDTMATDLTTTGTTTTNASLPPFSPEPREVPHEALYCTASVGVVPMVLPPDGVCDFIFFDSLYASGRFTLTDVVPKGELLKFLRRAGRSAGTEYGVGIAFERLSTFSNDIRKPEAKKFLVHLWEAEVVGYGVLSINDVHLSLEAVKEALLSVKTIAEIADSQASSTRSLTVLGVQATNQSACLDIAAAVRATYTPDVLIVLSHSTLVYGSRKDCVILPPGMSKIPSQESSTEQEPTHQLLEAARMVQCMEMNEIPVEVALASTLKARRYKPLYRTDYHVFGSCETDFFDRDASPVHLCDDKSKKYETHLKTALDNTVALTYDAKDRLLYVFDVNETNAQKYCAVKDNNPSRVFSIAAYDVNYDHGPGACSGKFKTGDFSRVEHLRRLVDFLRDTYTQTSAYFDCLRT